MRKNANEGKGDAVFNGLEYKPVSVMMPVPEQDENPYWGWFVSVPAAMRAGTVSRACASIAADGRERRATRTHTRARSIQRRAAPRRRRARESRSDRRRSHGAEEGARSERPPRSLM